MTIRAAIMEGTGILEIGSSGTPFLDAALLLSFLLKVDRSKLLALMPEELPKNVYDDFIKLINRRKTGEAVAYIVGTKEFYGLDFIVNKNVLIPRPDTELLVELVLADIDKRENKKLKCLDVFCGSGCIGISLAKENPELELTMADISLDAIEIAKQNAKNILSRDVKLIQSDILNSVDGKFDIITANPPYVDTAYTDKMITEGSFEPRLALDGGEDGLILYPRLAESAFNHLNNGGLLATEIGEEQGLEVQKILIKNGFSCVTIYKDLSKNDRVVLGVKDDI